MTGQTPELLIRREKELEVPAYIHCPHCEHPTVLPAAVPGRRYRCRQCNGTFMIRKMDDSPTGSDSHPLRSEQKSRKH